MGNGRSSGVAVVMLLEKRRSLLLLPPLLLLVVVMALPLLAAAAARSRALSSARASQKALCVSRLSFLHHQQTMRTRVKQKDQRKESMISLVN